MLETVAFWDEESGQKVEFTVEEQTTLGGNTYLLVSDGNEEDGEAYILKETENRGEETSYVMVENEEEFLAIAKVFSELLDEETSLEY